MLRNASDCCYPDKFIGRTTERFGRFEFLKVFRYDYEPRRELSLESISFSLQIAIHTKRGGAIDMNMKRQSQDSWHRQCRIEEEERVQRI